MNMISAHPKQAAGRQGLPELMGSFSQHFPYWCHFLHWRMSAGSLSAAPHWELNATPPPPSPPHHDLDDWLFRASLSPLMQTCALSCAAQASAIVSALRPAAPQRLCFPHFASLARSPST